MLLKMSTKLKCNQCNIVINELLCFIQNKLSVMDDDSLLRICVSSFTSEDIKQAKSLLFESVQTDRRNILRKQKGKENRDLSDIITLLKGTDPDITPLFVAQQLEKLPPVTFDHLDVTKLLKDLTVLKTQVESISTSFVSQDQLKVALTNLKYDSIPEQTLYDSSNINIRRGGAYQDSGPVGLSYVSETSNTQSLMENQIIFSRETRETPKKKDEGISTTSDTVSNTGDTESQRTTGSLSQPSTSSPPAQRSVDADRLANDAALVTSENLHGENVNNGWTKVSKRKAKLKYRYLGQMGMNSDGDVKFKAAERQCPIFITNIHVDTKEQDIVSHIYEKTKQNVTLQKILIKRETSHKAFKFFVPVSSLPLFLNETLWPKGVIFRRFVNYKHKLNRVTSESGRTSDLNV